MHPDIKSELLKENSNNKSNQQFIETISVPGYKLFSEIPNSQKRFVKSHFPFSLLPPSVMEQKCKVSLNISTHIYNFFFKNFT